MEKSKTSPKRARQRKLMLVIPLLTLPFITMVFWAMGGGRVVVAEQKMPQKGFNSKLPDAYPSKDEGMDKLNYYDRAALDSAKFEELKKKDPNFSLSHFQSPSVDSLSSQGKGRGQLIMSSYRDPNEQKVLQRLEALQKVMQQPPAHQERGANLKKYERVQPKPSYEMESLQALMQSVDGAEQEDREMQQINGMLENILDIQHPQRVQERLRKASQAERGDVLDVEGSQPQGNISLLGGHSPAARNFGDAAKHNGFYSLGNDEPKNIQHNAISVTVAETQILVNGSTVKLRLNQDVTIRGIIIPRDTFVYGTAALKGERLTIEISGIRFENSVFPVELALYDLDGLEGIYIPGAINRDVAKASADRSMQTLGVTTLDDSWGSQVAGAGIEAAKSLLSKKVKLVKVVVKAGYQALLVDTKPKKN